LIYQFLLTFVKMNGQGSLEIRIGPMFSGKTTWLNGELTTLVDIFNLRVCKITHTLDIRPTVCICDDSGSTHHSSFNGLTKKIKTFKVNNLQEIKEQSANFDVFGIDESQFFEDLVEGVKYLLDKGKHIRVVGLCGDKNLQKFGKTLDLIPFCDNIQKMSARCYFCLRERRESGFGTFMLAANAPFTLRMRDGLDGPDKLDGREQIDIGGIDKYVAVCRFHHAEHCAT
jgi:thymidine kinase